MTQLIGKTPPVETMVERVCKKAAPSDIMFFYAGKKYPAALEQILERLAGEHLG